MFFRNLVVYRLPADWSYSPIALEDALSQHPLRPCSPLEMLSRGWVEPASSGRLVHTVGTQQLIALGVDQKLLPASIVRQVARERAEALAAEQGFPVGRRQMRDLKFRVTEELKARALSRRRATRAWIDPEGRWFVVDAAGPGRAEETAEALRAALGSFAIVPLDTERSPQASMGLWLKQGEAPGRFTIDQDLELRATDASRATVRYTRHPLDGRQVQAHLSAGLAVTRLGLTWSDKVSFILDEKLQLKRVEFLDMGKDTPDVGEIDAAEQFDVDFALMAGELGRLLEDLTEVLGGEARREQAAAA